MKKATTAKEETTKGAVELAKNFAGEKGYTNVTSTLIYGVQWDATMQFIDNNYIEGTIAETSYVRNSTGKGNYGTGVLINTGSNENYKIKNIYDIAGNAWEWTMEAYSTTNRINRGGYYYSDGSYNPVSNRNYCSSENADAYVTLRTALYL